MAQGNQPKPTNGQPQEQRDPNYPELTQDQMYTLARKVYDLMRRELTSEVERYGKR